MAVGLCTQRTFAHNTKERSKGKEHEVSLVKQLAAAHERIFPSDHTVKSQQAHPNKQHNTTQNTHNTQINNTTQNKTHNTTNKQRNTNEPLGPAAAAAHLPSHRRPQHSCAPPTLRASPAAAAVRMRRACRCTGGWRRQPQAAAHMEIMRTEEVAEEDFVW